MNYDYEFLKDEVREDFYIPGMVKRSWATQLDVLDQIIRICDKYNLKWFAEYGTMIGAARHNGFIPWDDDVDISMFREDYIRFNQVCSEELPEDYVVLNFEREPEYDNFLTRVTCGNAIDTSANYLKEHNGFPYVAGVDIFVLDYVYPNEEDENIRKAKASLTYKYADLVASNPSIINNQTKVEQIIAEVYKATGFMIKRDMPLKNELLKITDHLFAEYNGAKSKEIALMYFWIKDNSHKYPIEYYKNIVRLPFEDRFMQLPVGFGEILRKNYGDWWRCVRKGGIHEYPFYSDQEKTLEKISSDRIGYKFSLDTAKMSNLLAEKESTRNRNKEILDIVSKAYNLAQNLISTNQVNEAKTLLEQVETISKDLDNRVVSNDALFVVTGDEDITLFLPEMLRISGDIELNTAVILAPFAHREDDWKLSEYSVDNLDDTSLALLESLDGIVDVYSSDQYDFARCKPKRIYIQIPFDEYSATESVLPFFYASNLVKHTEELILIPKYQIENADCTDERLIKNIENIVLSPGFVYSDRIITYSEEQKKIYLEVIRRKLSDEICIAFDEKIECIDNQNIISCVTKDDHAIGNIENSEVEDGLCENCSENESNKSDNIKTLLFYTSITDFYKDFEQMLCKLKNIFSIFKDSKDKLNVIWYMDEGFEINLETICEGRPDEICSIINDFGDGIGKIERGINIKNWLKNNKIDAFYGSAGYVMNLCVRLKTPVMIMNPECI